MPDSDIQRLVERIEGATGPDREIDLLIMRWVENIGGPAENALPYTASIDNAMTLLQSGWARTVLNIAEGGLSCATVGVAKSCAATPAIALASAAIRARITERTDDE